MTICPPPAISIRQRWRMFDDARGAVPAALSAAGKISLIWNLREIRRRQPPALSSPHNNRNLFFWLHRRKITTTVTLRPQPRRDSETSAPWFSSAPVRQAGGLNNFNVSFSSAAYCLLQRFERALSLTLNIPKIALNDASIETWRGMGYPADFLRRGNFSRRLYRQGPCARPVGDPPGLPESALRRDGHLRSQKIHAHHGG